MFHRKSRRHHSRWFKIVSRQGDDMSETIAMEAQEIVRRAAGNASGMIVKGQIRQAARNLGYTADSWRIREAWYGRAGNWSAQAIREIQHRFIQWRDREASRTAADQAARAARDLELLEKVRAEQRAELALVERRIAACKEALRVADPDPDR